MNDENISENNRPNSKYQLSNSNIDTSSKDNLTFYYNRERRLANAPQSVKDLYNEPPKTKFGLLNSLIADKPRRALFFIIILLCAVIFMFTRMGFFDNTHKLDGNTLEISGINVEESTIVIVRKKDGKADSYTGAVDTAVSVPGNLETNDMPVFYHRIYFSLENDEEFRFVVPFKAPELLMVLQSEKSTLQLSFKPK